MSRTTQRSEILRHLKEHGTITSKEAFELYGATRLSAQIFDLRKKYIIETHMMTGYTRYGDTCNYAKYEYKGEKEE